MNKTSATSDTGDTKCHHLIIKTSEQCAAETETKRCQLVNEIREWTHMQASSNRSKKAEERANQEEESSCQ